MKNTLIFLTFLVLFSSCASSEKYEMIAGNWVCSSWISQSDGKEMCQNNVKFSFNTDKTYSSTLDGNKQSGQFKMLGNVLYVTPTGKAEFGVKIEHLDADTLKLLMNRSGDEELLVLVKEKQ